MSRKRTQRALIAAAAAGLALSLALTGCASGGGTASNDAGPVDGGTLKFAIGNDPISFNPTGVGNGNDTWYVTRQVYDSLVYQNPDSQEIEPWLAKSYSVNDNATEFTFNLRDDVTFSDGSRLTATTIKANLDDAKAAGAASSAASYLASYTGTDVTDEHTAVVKFAKPNASFLSNAATVTLGIVSDKSLTVPFADRSAGTNIAGSGPFVLKSYTKDQSTTLAKRDGYTWAPASRGNTTGAHLDAVEFSVVPESGNRTGGLTSGQLDVAGGIAPNDIDTVAASNNTVERANPGTVFGVYFNEHQPVIADESVREAVGYAVDAQEIRDGALNDHFAVADSVLSQTTQDHEDASSVIPAHDPEKAKQVLEQAGWTEGSDGIREKDGQKLKFRISYINNFGPNADSIALLQQQLKAVGIDSVQISGTVPEFQETIKSGDYEVAWRNLSRVDGDVLRTDFSSAGTSNWPVDDAELNQRLLDQVSIGDQAQRSAEIKSLQKALIEQYHFVPVHELTTVLGTTKSVHGVSLGADSRLDLLVNAYKAN
ncbi:ABC transporter substrate-binding protein [Pseudoclavibacter sp. CFCC 14310]|uniref:ABC transporter substrate-binding protein n=1 Tax=Pseudoclavibacter sp. CFCC 14310 TaxID=2615180 RepID=UPI0013019120|nr:ABC transporter substrate-binding protein [Pseudoclavibacter sp. CFCC 14310]KAB1644470.1 ABC transporter substrate-binding protein [Pseudoclavibacter sp. CFCC 14310]